MQILVLLVEARPKANVPEPNRTFRVLSVLNTGIFDRHKPSNFKLESLSKSILYLTHLCWLLHKGTFLVTAQNLKGFFLKKFYLNWIKIGNGRFYFEYCHFETCWTNRLAVADIKLKVKSSVWTRVTENLSNYLSDFLTFRAERSKASPSKFFFFIL